MKMFLTSLFLSENDSRRILLCVVVVCQCVRVRKLHAHGLPNGLYVPPAIFVLCLQLL